MKQFEPADTPVEVVDTLAQVFIKEGFAVEFKQETVRTPDSKKKKPEKNKQQTPPENKMVYPGNNK